MKILVTGASGFIGKELVRYLEEMGHDVIGIGRRKDVEGISCYLSYDLSEEFPDIETDVVVHAAAGTIEKASFQYYFKNNVMMTENVLKHVKKLSANKIIYLSSVSAYGMLNSVLHEESPHNEPDGYGLSKYIAEKLIEDSEIPYYILSLPGVIGTGCNDVWLLKLASTLTKNDRLEYYNGENLFNNCVHVEDLCNFVGLILSERDVSCGKYLLGSADAMTIEEVIQYSKRLLRSSSQLQEMPKQAKGFHLDISKALAAGFRPKSLNVIIQQACEEAIRRKTR